MSSQNGMVQAMFATADQGIAAAGPNSLVTRRLEEMRDFYGFRFRELAALVSAGAPNARSHNAESGFRGRICPWCSWGPISTIKVKPISGSDAMPQPRNPVPIGDIAAGREVITIAAPLLTAAALSLSGIVASVEPRYFKWPGVTLLALILASLLLLASIELHYHARQFLYSRAEMDDWLPRDLSVNSRLYRQFCICQNEDFLYGSKFNARSAGCFNAGLVLLGVGVAIALAPPAHAAESEWRWTVSVLVFAGVLLDTAWTVRLYSRRNRNMREHIAEINAAKVEDSKTSLIKEEP